MTPMARRMARVGVLPREAHRLPRLVGGELPDEAVEQTTRRSGEATDEAAVWVDHGGR